MSSGLDENSLILAYHGRTDLQSAIRNAAAAGPEYVELFNHISAHILTLAPASSSEVHVAKKRKLLDGVGEAGSVADENDVTYLTPSATDQILLELKGISFILPQRKKYSLCFTKHHIYACLNEQPVAGTRLAWNEIEYIFLVPIPEKSLKQHGFLFFPTNSCIPLKKQALGPSPLSEPVVITVPSTSAPKSDTISGSLSQAASTVSDNYVSLLTWIITSRLTAAGNSIKITWTDEKLFASSQKQPHRPSEKAVSVKAFRGSKEGHLFFLPTGILWAFRKPLLFIPHRLISALSFTSVLSRTFNLSVDLLSESEEGPLNEEIEFSMLDQEDYDNISSYVKRHGLLDRSMAEQRKAKMLNINTVKDEAGVVIGNVEAGELAKANMSADAVDLGTGHQGIGGGDYDDEDDEDEEDYDPGSAGESEGSGSSSEDEADQDGDLAADTDEEGNMNL
ncbi:hypothetical protein K3495_g8430 [Podosphaera aphanis]|nr:hypothetical protein K3495_g8430 [Podosphaera aphanis]